MLQLLLAIGTSVIYIIINFTCQFFVKSGDVEKGPFQFVPYNTSLIVYQPKQVEQKQIEETFNLSKSISSSIVPESVTEQLTKKPIENQPFFIAKSSKMEETTTNPPTEDTDYSPTPSSPTVMNYDYSILPYQDGNLTILSQIADSAVVKESDFPPPTHLPSSSIPTTQIPSPSQSSSPTLVNDQQIRLDRYLEHMYTKQAGYNPFYHPLIIYNVHPESGVGNMIRGYLTGLVIASLTKRVYKIHSYLNYATEYLIPPFPNLCFCTEITGYRRYTWTFIPTYEQLPYYNRHHITHFLRTQNILLNTYSDYTSLAFNVSLYQEDFYKMGLIREIKPNRSAIEFGLEVRSIWLRLIMNPNESLCKLINKHISILKQKYMIGVQLRLGGSKANFQERPMLSNYGIEHAEYLIRKHVRKMNLDWNDVYIFVSSDSDYAVRKIRRDFIMKNNVSVIYTVEDFEIGHSAQAKTSRQGKSIWASYTKRAIIDLMILKESDYYIYSKRSSFGKFALELQKAYGSDIDVSKFLYSKGLNCSVYHKRDTVGLANYI